MIEFASGLGTTIARRLVPIALMQTAIGHGGSLAGMPADKAEGPVRSAGWTTRPALWIRKDR